jgi:hypothetical protein
MKAGARVYHSGTRVGLRYAAWLWVAGLLTLLSLVQHGQLIQHFGSAIPSDTGDPLLNTWILWWNAERLPLTDAYWNAPAFAPMPHAFALSETLLGLTWLTTPLQWLGASPLVAYNVMFVLEPVLNGLSAYWLCLTLTGRRDAALVGSFAFAFAPYHASLLSHLQTRAMFFMPIALAALHRYWNGHELRWLALFAAAIALNGLVSGYLLLYFGVLVTIVIGWLAIAFPDRRKLAAAVGAVAVAALPVWPVASTYRAVQRELNLHRSVTEVEALSADLSSIGRGSNRLVLWPVHTPVHRGELAGYPGIVIGALVVAAGLMAIRDRPPDRSSGSWRAIAVRGLAALSGAACVSGVIAFLIRRASYKVFGMAIDLGLIAVLLSARFSALVRSGSMLALYAIGAVIAWLFALGPVGRVFGHRFWYKAPFSWFMQWPGFDSARVPARFLSVEILCLGVIAAFAFARLWPVPKRSSLIGAVAIAAAIVIDGWVRLPVVPAPRPLPVAVTADLVVELPTWGYVEDVAAMYRGMSHGRPVVNGYSGFVPLPYAVFHADLKSGCVNSLEALRGGRSMDAVIWRGDASVASLDAALRRLWRAASREETADVIVYRQPRTAPETDPKKLNCRPNDRLSFPVEFEPVGAE